MTPNIDNTGQTDVTDALCEWVNNLGPGVHRLPEGRYRCEGGFHLVGRRGVVLDMRGAVIAADTLGYDVVPNRWNRDSVGAHRKHPVKDRAHIRLMESVDCHLIGPTVEGPNMDAGDDDAWDPEAEGQHAIKIEGGRNLVISSPRGGNVHGDLIYCTADYPNSRQGPDGVLVCDPRMEGTGRHLFAAVGGSKLTLTGDLTTGRRGLMRRARRAAMDFEPGVNTPVSNVVVDNMELSGFRLMFLASDCPGDVSHVLIRDVITDQLNMKVRAQNHRRSDWRFENVVGCKQAASDKPLMQFFRIDGLSITDCYNALRAGRSERAVMTVESTQRVVADNDWPVHLIGTRQPTSPPRQGVVRHFDTWAAVEAAGWD